MLSGHTDVVPVDGQDWHSDPFAAAGRRRQTVRPRHGRHEELHRRHPRALAGGRRPAALHADPPRLVPRRGDRLHWRPRADRGAQGGRSGRVCASSASRPLMQPVIAHKGKRSFHCHVLGFECHSALTHAASTRSRRRPSWSPSSKAMARQQARAGSVRRRFTCRPIRRSIPGRSRAAPRSTSYRGNAASISNTGSARRRPGRPIEELQRLCRKPVVAGDARGPKGGLDRVRRAERIPRAGHRARWRDHPARTIAERDEPHRQGRFGSEAGLFQEAGIPTVVCGPGSIEQAHKPDEFIALDQIEACEAFIGRLFDRAAA